MARSPTGRQPLVQRQRSAAASPLAASVTVATTGGGGCTGGASSPGPASYLNATEASVPTQILSKHSPLPLPGTAASSCVTNANMHLNPHGAARGVVRYSSYHPTTRTSTGAPTLLTAQRSGVMVKQMSSSPVATPGSAVLRPPMGLTQAVRQLSRGFASGRAVTPVQRRAAAPSPDGEIMV